MAFEDRAEAGRTLARRLEKYRGRHPLVLAIPRGAVPMGKIVADALDGELDVVLVRKLRAPQNPELAIGSIDETGVVYWIRDTRDLWDDLYLEEEKNPIGDAPAASSDEPSHGSGDRCVRPRRHRAG